MNESAPRSSPGPHLETVDERLQHYAANGEPTLFLREWLMALEKPEVQFENSSMLTSYVHGFVQFLKDAARIGKERIVQDASLGDEKLVAMGPDAIAQLSRVLGAHLAELRTKDDLLRLITKTMAAFEAIAAKGPKIP